MKVLVCVKQAKVLGDEVEFTHDSRDVAPGFLERALNEWDASAIEAAIRLRERVGSGEIVVVTCGDQLADGALRRCLAMGADRAIRVDCDFLDPTLTARALAPVAMTEVPDLILCGAQSSDAVQGSTGTALAGLLGMPCVAVVTMLDWVGSGPATVHRELEGGLIDVVEVDTPAVLTIQTGLNQPRYATLRAIKVAELQEIAVIPGPDGGEPAYRVRRMFSPPEGARAQILDGGPSEIAQQIAVIIKERLK